MSVLVYGLGERFSLPHPAAEAVVIGACAAFAVATGWWSLFAGGVLGALGDLTHRVRQIGERRAASGACTEAARELGDLLARHEEALRSKSWWARGRRCDRRLIAEYKAHYRRRAQDAIREANMVVTVPPEIARCAARPRSMGDLQYVCGWLRRIGEDYE